MLWNIIYTLLVVFLLAVLLSVIGVFTIPAISVTLLQILYTLLVITVIITVLHWIGIF